MGLMPGHWRQERESPSAVKVAGQKRVGKLRNAPNVTAPASDSKASSSAEHESQMSKMTTAHAVRPRACSLRRSVSELHRQVPVVDQQSVALDSKPSPKQKLKAPQFSAGWRPEVRASHADAAAELVDLCESRLPESAVTPTVAERNAPQMSVPASASPSAASPAQFPLSALSSSDRLSRKQKIDATRDARGLKAGANADHQGAAAALADLFAPSPRESAVAPAVVVRRKRHVAGPADNLRNHASPDKFLSSLPSSSDTNEDRRPRVFVVKRPTARNTLLNCPEFDVPNVSGSPAPVVGQDDPARATKHAATGPGQRVAESRQLGEVVAVWPTPSEVATDSEPPSITLSELEAELAMASRTLNSLVRGRGEWSFDLTITARWAKVESALQNLRDLFAERHAADHDALTAVRAP